MTTEQITVPPKSAVRKAGNKLRENTLSYEEMEDALTILSEWRACYYRPINTIQVLVRKKIESLKIKPAIVAQRLKRTPSIIAKLKRFPKMDLERMQDIGGIRAVVNNVDEVKKLHEALRKGRHKHEVLKTFKDYIANPKPDGYRGIHQVMKYEATQHKELSGLLVEIQIRTRLQHYWATAVETMGVIEKSSFKTGGGDEKFKQFFRLCSALFSIEEKQPIVESLSQLPPEDIARQFEALETELGVFAKLTAFTKAVSAVEGVENKNKAGYYLLILDAREKKISFIPFSKDQAQLAERMYMLLENKEKDNSEIDVVLTAAAGMKDLKTAYPNYFVDTRSFIKHLKVICSRILEKK